MSQTTSLSFSPFIQIKAGSRKPTIFIAHGLCGRVLFSQLAKQIETANPVYGIQARGVDGAEEPLERVENMARLYLEALERCPAEKSYALIGYSFGGLVALEMARDLLHAGKPVELLVLIDTYPHPRFLSVGERRRVFLKRVQRHFRKISRRPMWDGLSYLIAGIQRRLKIASSFENISNIVPSPLDGALDRVNSKAYQAYESYKPKFYPGKIKFVTTEVKTFFPKNPAAVWGRLVGGIEIDVIPGDHLSIVNKDFVPLGAVLTRYMQELDSGSNKGETKEKRSQPLSL